MFRWIGYNSSTPCCVPLLKAKNRKLRLRWEQAHKTWAVRIWLGWVGIIAKNINAWPQSALFNQSRLVGVLQWCRECSLCTHVFLNPIVITWRSLLDYCCWLRATFHSHSLHSSNSNLKLVLWAWVMIMIMSSVFFFWMWLNREFAGWRCT